MCSHLGFGKFGQLTRLFVVVNVNESIEVSKFTNEIQVDHFEINETILSIVNFHSNLDVLCAIGFSF